MTFDLILHLIFVGNPVTHMSSVDKAWVEFGQKYFKPNTELEKVSGWIWLGS